MVAQAARRSWSKDIELTPAEVLRRNFWFCGLDEVAEDFERIYVHFENWLGNKR